MARSIKEIKKGMTDVFMADVNVQQKYGFAASDSFEDKFSAASVESVLFYVFAFAIYLLERVFDTHREEVETALEAKTPHTVAWYRQLVLGFTYNGGQPVTCCSVDDSQLRMKIKIAGGSEGNRSAVSSETADALESYLEQEKDAGLKFEIVSRPLKSTLLTSNVYSGC